MNGRAVLIVCALAVGGGSACKGRGGGGGKGPALATVGDSVVTASDLRAKIAEQPAFSRARYQAPEKRKELLETMIRSELLLQEARRRGLHEDPEVKAVIERVLIHRLTRAHAEERDKQNPTAEAELRAYYDQHRSEFVTPTRVRVSHVFLAAPAKGPERARVTAEARALLRQIQSKEARGDKQVLEVSASKRSDDAATKATGGDLGYRTKEELAGAWGAPLADAAFALTAPSAIGDPVVTDSGVHLVKLLGRQEGYETSFTAARSRIENRLHTERQTTTLDALVTSLRAKAEVKVDEEALKEMEVGTAGVAGHRPAGT